jgi:hypothetical protein
MKNLIRSFVIVAAVLSTAASGQSTTGPEPMAMLDGAAMRWLSIAYTEVIALKVDPSRYTVRVEDQGDTVLVVLSKPGLSPFIRGSPPGFPSVEIEITKKDGKVSRRTRAAR